VDDVTIDIALNLLGLLISIVGLFVAKLTKPVVLTVVVCSLIVTTGIASWLALDHQHKISKTETELEARLSHNRWTLEQIYSEMGQPDYKIIREALERAVEDGTIKDQPTECIINDGSVLSTRVYFNTKVR